MATQEEMDEINRKIRDPMEFKWRLEVRVAWLRLEAACKKAEADKLEAFINHKPFDKRMHL